jgi:hypothetical protein
MILFSISPFSQIFFPDSPCVWEVVTKARYDPNLELLQPANTELAALHDGRKFHGMEVETR